MKILSDRRWVYTLAEVCEILGINKYGVHSIQTTDDELVVTFVTEE